jgi:DNA-binding response OmpR family regulator
MFCSKDIAEDTILDGSRKQQQEPRRSSKSKKYRILIVDDESDIALSLRMGLEIGGFKVDSFIDPQTALSKFKAGVYDIALIDIRMPKMNGFELYRKLIEVDDKIKYCFMTAYEVYYETLKKDYPTLDVGCFIKKPIEPDYLVKRLISELQSLVME